MKAYEGGTAAYFATPPVNLVYALNASLSTITSEGPSLDDRLKYHREVSKKVRSTVRGWGLSIVSLEFIRTRMELSTNGIKDRKGR
jgi:alanine-glyoxylate transaminase / serine-glyoxylate transaminase / serine-pyruvate transaminase